MAHFLKLPYFKGPASRFLREIPCSKKCVYEQYMKDTSGTCVGPATVFKVKEQVLGQLFLVSSDVYLIVDHW